MYFIINHLNNTKYDLFSKQGKQLLKQYIRIYKQKGGSNNIGEKIHKKAQDYEGKITSELSKLIFG